MALDPRLPPAARTSTCSTPTTGPGRRPRCAALAADALPHARPGATGDGCVVSGRLSRLQAAGTHDGAEQVLIEDWCQQYPSHSVGDLAFGADGALYVSGGDGASFNFVDYGQDGSPVNPCGDPPGRPAAALTPPTAEGGALRSQDLRTTGRPDRPRRRDPARRPRHRRRRCPATRSPPARTPTRGGSSPTACATRSASRSGPGTNEVWVGDVGWNAWEEINRIPTPDRRAVENFGWPCYEGDGAPGAATTALNLDHLRDPLRARAGASTAPLLHVRPQRSRSCPARRCPTGSSSISGLAFYDGGGAYPAAYDGALFFADYSRDCIWVDARAAPTACPNPAPLADLRRRRRRTRSTSQIGPGGDLFYADLDGGTIQRIRYLGRTAAPTARATANADRRAPRR